MKISEHVTRMLNVSGWYVDRLADLAVARAHDDITEREFEELRADYLAMWQLASKGI